MTVSLTPEMEKFIAEKVRTGQFRTSDEAVNALLAENAERERLAPEDIALLRDELDPALAEADRGEFVEFTAEDIIAEGRAALDARRKRA